ncbi:MAG TPA: hypothetical protein VHB21_14895 [Minicystis sp.]|nr:hypothetical protein [Minicystis sp.]
MLVRSSRTAAWAVFSAVLLGLLLWSRPSAAYPWMIRHEYTGCIPCHADPSGAGLLTEYGRAQGELLLRTRYGAKKGDEEEAGSAAGFLWFMKEPDWLLVGASFRNGILFQKAEGQPEQTQFLQMEADAKAQVTLKRFRAYASVGFLHEGGQATWITTNQAGNNLVSREHWIGVDLGEDKNWLLRGGRIDVPFGIRQDEHNLLVRTVTRTDIDSTQQDGVSLSYTSNSVRGELMGIAGNYQINPDAYRERGYAGYVEFNLATGYAVGVSSLLTYAAKDIQANVPLLRQAHGAFARISPAKPIVFLAECDALLDKAQGTPFGVGVVGMAQADLEPIQGVHGILTGEVLRDPVALGPPQWAGYVSADWFFAPHADVRVDAMTMLIGPTQQNVVGLLAQFHVYL